MVTMLAAAGGSSVRRHGFKKAIRKLVFMSSV